MSHSKAADALNYQPNSFYVVSKQKRCFLKLPVYAPKMQDAYGDTIFYFCLIMSCLNGGTSVYSDNQDET